MCVGSYVNCFCVNRPMLGELKVPKNLEMEDECSGEESLRRCCRRGVMLKMKHVSKNKWVT